jgi:hypothetical protein
MKFFRVVIFLAAALISEKLLAQITISGIVVDSVSMEPLTGSNVKLKHANRGVITDERGMFIIFSESYDTLIISRIGYRSYVYPFFGTDKDALFMLRQEVKQLKEVVVNFYSEEKPTHSPQRVVKKMTVGDAINSPFTYFSKAEKEKRILVRWQTEYSKIQAYVDLVTSEKFKIETMEKYNLDENRYYDLLSKFNEQNRSAQYLKDDLEITKKIHFFFEQQLRAAE